MIIKSFIGIKKHVEKKRIIMMIIMRIMITIMITIMIRIIVITTIVLICPIIKT